MIQIALEFENYAMCSIIQKVKNYKLNSYEKHTPITNR